MAALSQGAGGSTCSTTDSMCIYCRHYPGLEDTLDADYEDSTGWIGYRSDCVYRVQHEGANRFSVRFLG
ncbi:MAG: hypothetical protein ABIK62_07120 [candidate division WOR-3 bacterium]